MDTHPTQSHLLDPLDLTPNQSKPTLPTPAPPKTPSLLPRPSPRRARRVGTYSFLTNHRLFALLYSVFRVSTPGTMLI